MPGKSVEVTLCKPVLASPADKSTMQRVWKACCLLFCNVKANLQITQIKRVCPWFRSREMSTEVPVPAFDKYFLFNYTNKN